MTREGAEALAAWSEWVVYDQIALREMLNALDPADPQTPPCVPDRAYPRQRHGETAGESSHDLTR